MTAPRGPHRARRLPVVGRVLTIAGASMVAAGVAFLVNIISARALGPEYRGHVATVLQVAYLAAPLVGLGAERALLRHREGVSDRGHVLPSVVSMLLGAGLIAFIVWPIYGPWVMLAAPVALVSVTFGYYRADALNSRAIRGYLISFLAYQASILLGSLALLLLEVTVWQWWVAVYIVPGIFLAAYGLYRVRRRTVLPVANIVVAVKRNAALLTAGLSKLIATRLNRVILPVIAGADSLGLFIVVATATEPLYWLAQSMADHRTTTGAGSRLAGRGAVVRVLLRDALIFAPLGAVGGVALYLLLVPLFGQAYAPALELVLPLTLAAIVLASFRQAAGLVLSSIRPDRVGTTETIAAVAAVVIYPVTIYFWGAAGAAWGTIAVYLIGLVAAVIFFPAGGGVAGDGEPNNNNSHDNSDNNEKERSLA